MKARIVVFLMLMAFSVTIAVVIGQRLSERAMTVAVGVVAGVAASIPTSVFISWMVSRVWLQRATMTEAALPDRPVESRAPQSPWPYPSSLPTNAAYASPAALPYPVSAAPGYVIQPPPMPRSFQVIGGADVSLESQAVPTEEPWPP